jgi:glycosyltransferase involved in cell wall biosynthesis
VVVLVNGCRSGSERVLAPSDRLRVEVVDRQLDLGSARAALVAAARGDVVLLIDDDVLVEPGLAAGHRRHHADGARAIVQGYMPVADPTTTPARIYAFNYETQVPRWEADGDSILYGLWGGNLSIRRADALEVPPRNPAFWAHANQDREWGLRLLRAGFRGRFDRTLRAQHLYERTVRQFVRYQRNTGAGTWLVHALHHDLIGPMPQDNYFAHLPPWQRRLVRLARRPRSHGALRAALALAEAADRLPVGDRARRETLTLALTMAQQRAALEASRR